jgi:hypothetical protein
MGTSFRPLLGGLVALSLVACATCRDHPVACGVGVAFIAGSIAATAATHADHSVVPGMRTVQPVTCTGTSCH